MAGQRNQAANELWSRMSACEHEVFLHNFALPDKGGAIEHIANALDPNIVPQQQPQDNNMLVSLMTAGRTSLAVKLMNVMSERTGDWRVFLTQSLSMMCVDKFGRESTVLHEAARCGDCATLWTMLENDDALINRANNDGDTPVHLAAAYRHETDVDVLLRSNTIRLERNGAGFTALHYAAAVKNPSAELIEYLVRHAKTCDPGMLNVQSNLHGDTAMHLACQNDMMTAECLQHFRDADPTVWNNDSMTPLHVAANRDHDAHGILVCLLDMFLPVISKMAHIEPSPPAQGNHVQDDINSGHLLVNSLLLPCARKCHADAVGLLIRYGAELGEVLHSIVEESAKRPKKTPKLIAVYNSIVANIDTSSNSVLTDLECDRLKPASHEFNTWWTLIELTNKPHIPSGKNVIERAIELGAKDMLMAILKTPGIYRIEGTAKDRAHRKDCGWLVGDIIHLDVTNMIEPTLFGDRRSHGRVGPEPGLQFQRPRPSKSYLEQITESEDLWRKHDILQKQPFKKLSKSYAGFVKRLYLLTGSIQLAYMLLLTIYYLPSRCSLGEQFNMNFTDCIGTTINYPGVPSWGWLVWPILQLTYHLLSFIGYVYSLSNNLYLLYTQRPRLDDYRNIGGETESFVPQLVARLADTVLFWGFSCMFLVWYSMVWDSGVSYTVYLEVTSMLFLFGWLVNFMMFSRVSKEIYVMSLVLRSVIIDDLLLHFLPVFLFVVVAFSFAINVLEQIFLESRIGLGQTVYEVFVSAFTVGNLYDVTLDPDYTTAGGHIGFLKAVFALYLALTALILFTYLIAMISSRYKLETPNAENGWRFDCVASVIRLEKLPVISVLLSWIHRLDYWLWFWCTPNYRQIYDIRSDDGRYAGCYFVAIKKWRKSDKLDDDKRSPK